MFSGLLKFFGLLEILKVSFSVGLELDEKLQPRLHQDQEVAKQPDWNRTLTELLTSGDRSNVDDDVLAAKVLQVIDETSRDGDSLSDDIASEGLMVDETTDDHESYPGPCSNLTSLNLFENGTNVTSDGILTCQNLTRLNNRSDISFNDTLTNLSLPLDVDTMSNTTAVPGVHLKRDQKNGLNFFTRT